MTETAYDATAEPTRPPAEPDHDVPADLPSPPGPLVAVPPAPRRSPAEEARTLVAGTRTATLATLSEDGTPWASLVMYGMLADGGLALMVSTLAEHGRNLERDPRASVAITPPSSGADPLQSPRVTLAGRVERPGPDDEAEVRAAYEEAVSAARVFGRFGDFSLWVLRVARVRWIGGFGVMGSDDAAAYAAAEPDPVAPTAERAIAHLNADHADSLLEMARTLAGYGDATAARCGGADRYGLSLEIETPRGAASARVAFAARVDAPDGLRAATVELARRARVAGA